MPWVRFDDQFPLHRKVAGLNDKTYRLHSEAIFWCARNLTDGHIPKHDLNQIRPALRSTTTLAAHLVSRGLWHLAGDDCPSDKCPAPAGEDGWVIHDYWDYQPSKAQVIREREANARRQKQWRETHRNGVTDSVTGSVTDTVTNTAPSRPVPSSSGSVINPVQQGNGRARDDLIELIINELQDATGRIISHEWAAKTRDYILEGRRVSDPAAYIRQTIRAEPDPKTRFLPLYGPP